MAPVFTVPALATRATGRAPRGDPLGRRAPGPRGRCGTRSRRRRAAGASRPRPRSSMALGTELWTSRRGVDRHRLRRRGLALASSRRRAPAHAAPPPGRRDWPSSRRSRRDRWPRPGSPITSLNQSSTWSSTRLAPSSKPPTFGLRPAASISARAVNGRARAHDPAPEARMDVAGGEGKHVRAEVLVGALLALTGAGERLVQRRPARRSSASARPGRSRTVRRCSSMSSTIR